MTDDEMRWEILTVLGWKICTTSGSECWISPDKIHTTSGNVSLPDLLNDLNAMREAVGSLKPDDANKWADELTKLTAFGANPAWTHWFHLANASCRDRAIAFLRTIGKLK